MSGEVLACANCDNSRVSKDSAPAYNADQIGENVYYCRDCGGIVDTVKRPPKDGAHGGSVSGTARELADMTEDEVEEIFAD